MTIGLAFLAVFLVIFLVPVAVYGTLSALTGLQPPGDRPLRFLSGVAVSKLGMAVAFVGLWHLTGGAIAGGWPVYALVWWIMFALGEIGQTLGPDYSPQEAAAGVVSETLYLPAAAWIVAALA